MVDEVEKYRIPLFDGTNFNNWKFRMEILLDEMDLLELTREPYTDRPEIKTEGTRTDAQNSEFEKLKRLDRKCKSQIVQKIADSHLEYAKDKLTAAELWQSLCNTFERKGMASQLFIRKSLLTMKFNVNNDTLANHFLKFDRLIRELRSTGATLEETDVVCHLLLSMPQEYNTVVTALETLSPDKLIIGFVKNRLLDEETKRKGSMKSGKSDAPSTSAFSSATGKHGTPRDGKKSGTSNQSFQFKCHHCGKIGHKRSECRFRNQENKQGGNSKANLVTKESKPETEFCFLTSDTELEEKMQFILDSGASDHLARDKEGLINVEKLPTPIIINVAKAKTTLVAKYAGELQATTLVNGNEIPITVKRILIVPGLSHNLLSVRRLETNGFEIRFKNGSGVIEKHRKVVAVATREGTSQLYTVQFQIKEVASHHCSSEERLKIWHKRLGHLNFDSLKKMNLEKLETGTKHTKICDTCVEGKQVKLPHNNHRHRATRPLQLVHSDLFGPVTPTSYDGKRYLLTFIDDFTHFTAAYALEAKSEVYKFFKVYEAMATAHFNMKISRFRCDNGREYISNDIRSFFDEKGIQCEFTIRYTPEQNGVAERMNRTIIERARCMILNSKLTKNFWSEAALTAVYLINRSPTSALDGELPATLWYKETPNLKKLRVFGCVAFLKIPKEISGGKFDSRSKRCFMLGYCANGYKLWCPEEKKIIYGRDVVFDESRFQFDGTTSEDWLVSNQQSTEHEEESTEHEKTVQDQEKPEEEEEEIQSDEEEEIQNPRRSTRHKVMPNYLLDYATIALSAESFVDDIPETYEDIQGRDDRDNWNRAVQEEIRSLIENETWKLADLPPGRKAIDNKWVFKLKRDQRGNIDRYKARLVIKGCAQRKGYDYEETYAPVARLVTFRSLISVINQENLYACQMDVKNAFLHGQLKEEIYMKLPPGLPNNETKVCKLKKALYGLKQAPRAWNGTFDRFAKKLGFQHSEADRCLYVLQTESEEVYLLLYVDDIVIAGRNKTKIEEIKKSLEKGFKMTDLGTLHSSSEST